MLLKDAVFVVAVVGSAFVSCKKDSSDEGAGNVSVESVAGFWEWSSIKATTNGKTESVKVSDDKKVIVAFQETRVNWLSLDDGKMLCDDDDGYFKIENGKTAVVSCDKNFKKKIDIAVNHLDKNHLLASFSSEDTHYEISMTRLSKESAMELAKKSQKKFDVKSGLFTSFSGGKTSTSSPSPTPSSSTPSSSTSKYDLETAEEKKFVSKKISVIKEIRSTSSRVVIQGNQIVSTSAIDTAKPFCTFYVYTSFLVNGSTEYLVPANSDKSTSVVRYADVSNYQGKYRTIISSIDKLGDIECKFENEEVPTYEQTVAIFNQYIQLL